ncbi:MAG: transposase family protein [Verrucomicrobiae bacterium]|nr:transposase family protein [Verrucomicrobiae bacterium]
MPMASGFLYLVALMDWWSRYVVAWELSNTLDSEFCIRAWTAGLATGRQPLISNTDQGSQFTSEAFLEAVEAAGWMSAWMVVDAGSTTGSSSGSGAASSRRTSTCRTMPTG